MIHFLQGLDRRFQYFGIGISRAAPGPNPTARSVWTDLASQFRLEQRIKKSFHIGALFYITHAFVNMQITEKLWADSQDITSTVQGDRGLKTRKVGALEQNRAKHKYGQRKAQK